MILTGIGNNGGIGISTLLANFFHYMKEKGKEIYWMSLSDRVPPVLLSLETKWTEKEILYRKVPKWNKSACKFCDVCVKACEAGALSRYSDFYIIYPELCISCSACIYACKKNALEFDRKKIGSIECENTGSNILRVMLNHREIFSPWHTKQVFEFINKFSTPDNLIIVDVPSGFRELWTELINLSDIVLMYTNDLTMWETLYKSLTHDQAQVLLAVNEVFYESFSDAGYSFALSVPHHRLISEEAIKGKVITDEHYKFILQEIQFKLNLD